MCDDPPLIGPSCDSLPMFIEPAQLQLLDNWGSPVDLFRIHRAAQKHSD
ncbi:MULTISPECIES: hypothetical protein [unclassified Nocardia]